MRQQCRFTQHQFAHRLEILQRGAVTKTAEILAHLGKSKFRFVTKAEKGLGTAHFLACSGDCQNFVRGHRVRAGLSWIAAKGAVAAIVPAQVRQRQKHFSRISDDARLEPFFGGPRRFEQLRKFMIAATHPRGGRIC